MRNFEFKERGQMSNEEAEREIANIETSFAIENMVILPEEKELMRKLFVGQISREEFNKHWL